MSLVIPADVTVILKEPGKPLSGVFFDKTGFYLVFFDRTVVHFTNSEYADVTDTIKRLSSDDKC